MEKAIKGRLILENGEIFDGKAFGHVKETVGEVVFTTGMTGYQESITDPSFANQIVVMTYPLIGNYGINLEDMEARTPALNGLIVREKCDYPNNWRCEMNLEGFMKHHRVMGIEGIDTRALTRILRDSGTMKGIITTRAANLTKSQISQKFGTYSNKNAVLEVTTKEKYTVEGKGLHLALLDFGVKHNIIRSLSKRGCKITVFPALSTVEEIMKINPDGIFLSNGPGDPHNLPSVVENVKELMKMLPIAGICLGHQILATACGCSIKRMKFGHHGGNHPVKNTKTGRCFITSQNHEFVVDKLAGGVSLTWCNVNDKTVEGIRHEKLPVASVQFHPEAAPGPLDTGFIFDEYLKMFEERKIFNA